MKQKIVLMLMLSTTQDFYGAAASNRNQESCWQRFVHICCCKWYKDNNCKCCPRKTRVQSYSLVRRWDSPDLQARLAQEGLGPNPYDAAVNKVLAGLLVGGKTEPLPTPRKPIGSQHVTSGQAQAQKKGSSAQLVHAADAPTANTPFQKTFLSDISEHSEEHMQATPHLAPTVPTVNPTPRSDTLTLPSTGSGGVSPLSLTHTPVLVSD